MASRIITRIRPLIAPTRPLTRGFSLLPTPRRPRLPYLLRPTNTPRPTLHPTRRLISANTKEYLLRESLIAARVIVYGYTAIFIASCTAFGAAIIYTENQHPTPTSLPFSARFSLAFARVLLTWTESRWAAIEILKDAITRLEKQGWSNQDADWRIGYIMALKLLAELEEAEGGADNLNSAREHYQRIVDTPRESEAQEVRWVGMKLAAALRVSRIEEFRKDLGAAEDALEQAVDVVLPVGVRELPLPGESANTTVLLKALTEMGVFFARHGEEARALELFTRVLAARRAVGTPSDPADPRAAETLSDPCAEAVTMVYIGEVLFAMGERGKGVSWSKEGYEKSAPLAEMRGACKECALVAARNISTMVALMEEGAGENKKKGRWSSFFGSSKEELGESVEKWDKAVELLENIRTTRGL